MQKQHRTRKQNRKVLKKGGGSIRKKREEYLKKTYETYRLEFVNFLKKSKQDYLKGVADAKQMFSNIKSDGKPSLKDLVVLSNDYYSKNSYRRTQKVGGNYIHLTDTDFKQLQDKEEHSENDDTLSRPMVDGSHQADPSSVEQREENARIKRDHDEAVEKHARITRLEREQDAAAEKHHAELVQKLVEQMKLKQNKRNEENIQRMTEEANAVANMADKALATSDAGIEADIDANRMRINALSEENMAMSEANKDDLKTAEQDLLNILSEENMNANEKAVDSIDARVKSIQNDNDIYEAYNKAYMKSLAAASEEFNKRHEKFNKTQEEFKKKFAEFAEEYEKNKDNMKNGWDTLDERLRSFSNFPPEIIEHFRVFGLQPTTNLNKIRTHYYKQALKYHPDKGGDAIKFAEISNNYEAINDYITKNM